jgi:hypothetical protein
MAGKVDSVRVVPKDKATELMKMEKRQDDMPGAGDKQTELIKILKKRESVQYAWRRGQANRTHENGKRAGKSGRCAWRGRTKQQNS